LRLFVKFRLVEKKDPFKNLKIGIWIYILLLIFEGALRKWIFPSLSNPLILVRDPIAFWLIYKALQKKIIKPNFYFWSFTIIGLLSYFSATINGHGSQIVALFGLRSFVLHLPLIFVIGAVFNRYDCIKVGYFIIILLVPMSLLTIVQFYSPQTSFVNLSVVGGEEGAGFGGALGFYRPPGTFSFINGLSLFYGMTSCYVLYFLFNKSELPKFIIGLAVVCTLVSIPFTISRTVFYQTLLSTSFALIIILKKPAYLKFAIGAFLVTFISMIFLSEQQFIKSGIEAFTARFEDASESEGGVTSSILGRTFGGLIDAISTSVDRRFWGDGLGSWSSFGFKTLGKTNDISVTDFEWSRTIEELGLLLGLYFILVRVLLSVQLLKQSIKKLNSGDFLPWMLMSFGLIVLLQGQIAQPTSLGFLTLITGLTISSLKSKSKLNYSGRPK